MNNTYKPSIDVLFYKSGNIENKRFQHALFDFQIMKRGIKKWLKSKISSFEWRI